MSSPQVKRILADLRYLKKNNLDNGVNNIWVKIDEDNIEKMYAMIKGSDDTPYRGGFYFFDITFPKNYPHSSPHVKFCTLHPSVRVNPNLYRGGKVCLSLLGTWTGPGWTSCNNIASVLLSIQSMVLNNKPLENEPGFENASELELLKYSYVVEYFNYEVAVLSMIQNPPGIFKIFHDEMIEIFLKNKDKYIENINMLRENLIKKVNILDKTTNKNIDVAIFPQYKSHNYLHSGVYNMALYPDFDILLSKIHSLNSKDQMLSNTKKIELDDERKNIIYLRSRVNKSTSLSDIQSIASKLDINVHKVSPSSGKQIKKTKANLLSDIDSILDNSA